MTSKGLLFEKEVAGLFEQHGFRVKRNAKGARPRQTDLIAIDSNNQLYIVEVKNVKKRIDVSVIDEIRSRLRRMPSDVVGIIIALSGYTVSAIKEVESSRDREVLIFDKVELIAIHRGRASLQELIHRKREALRVDGRIWSYRPFPYKRRKVKLPESRQFFQIDGKKHGFVRSGSNHCFGLFVRDIPDTDWGSHDGGGMILKLRLDLSTVEDLANLVQLLEEKFGSANQGSFSIHQTETTWFGFGAKNLLEAISSVKKRYKSCRAQRFHHSEQIHYFDRLIDGWLLLSTQYSAPIRQTARFHMSELSIQLRGLPVDMDPFKRLSNYTNNPDARFQYVASKHTVDQKLKKPIPINVVGEIVQTDSRSNRSVVGLLIKNPFYQTAQLPEELKGGNSLTFEQVKKVELMICDLRDWHDVGDIIDQYVLLGFEASLAGGLPVIRPFATWKNILKRARRMEPDDKWRQLLKEASELEQREGLFNDLHKQKEK